MLFAGIDSAFRKVLGKNGDGVLRFSDLENAQKRSRVGEVSRSAVEFGHSRRLELQGKHVSCGGDENREPHLLGCARKCAQDDEVTRGLRNSRGGGGRVPAWRREL